MSKIQRVFFTTNNMVLDNFEYPHIDSSGQAFCPLARVSTSNISWLLFGGFLHHESQGENISNFIQMVKVQFQTRNLLLDTFETTDRRSAIKSFFVKGSVPTKSQWNVWYFAKPPGLVFFDKKKVPLIFSSESTINAWNKLYPWSHLKSLIFGSVISFTFSQKGQNPISAAHWDRSIKSH